MTVYLLRVSSFLFLTLAVVLVGSVSSVSLQQKNNNPSLHRYDALVDWLWNLTIAIPDQHFREYYLSLDIQNMTCSHFSMDAIHSAYDPNARVSKSSQSKNPTMDFTISGVTATCQGIYYTTGLSGHLTATIASSSILSPMMSSSEKAPLQFSLIIQSNWTTTQNGDDQNIRLLIPSSIKASSCEPNLYVSKLRFSGSISARLINLFRLTIRRYISDSLSTELCPMLGMTFETTLTNAIQQMDRYMLELIRNQTKRNGPVNPTAGKLKSSWNWNQNAPLVPTILRLVNSVVIEPFLNEGFFLKILQRITQQEVDGNCGYFFRGWNGLLQQITQGTISLPIPDIPFLKNITFEIPQYGVISLLPQNVILSNYEKLDQFRVLAPDRDGNQFESKFIFPNGGNISFDLKLVISEASGGSFQGDDLIESFQFTVQTSSMDIASSVSLDLNATRLKNIRVNHVLSAMSANAVPHDIGCSLSPIQSLHIENVTANIGLLAMSLHPHSTHSTLEHDLDEVINTLLTLVIAEYEPFLALSLSGWLSGPAKAWFDKSSNDWIQELIQNAESVDSDLRCFTPAMELNSSTSDFLNLSTTSLVKFNRYLQESLDTINPYVECLSDVVKRQVETLTPTFDYGGISWRFQNLNFDHVDTVSNLEFLSPKEEGFHLISDVQWGSCEENITDDYNHSCYGPSASLITELSIPSRNVTGTVNLTAAVGYLRESMSVVFLYDLVQLRNLTLWDAVSCHFCFAKPAKEAVLYAIPQVIDQLSFKMDVSLEEKQNAFFHFNIDSGSYEGATSALKSSFAFIQINFMEMGNQLLIKTIGAAKVVCGGGDENDNNSMLNLLIGLLVVLIPLYILSHILFLLDNKPNDQEEEREEGHSPTELRSYEFRNAFAVLMKKDTSLFTKERISFNTRHFFPIILISTLALLITSNLSVGATVDLSLSTKDPKDTFHLPSLFTFSLGNTVHDMYESKIYVLLFIVVIFSGAWPYMKLILMMWTWMAPESSLSSQNRGLLLYSLDALSKFSLVDTFVLIIMMVSFRFKVQVGDAIVDLFVNPHFGFYGFLLATTISLLAGRAELHLHRKSSSILAINHSDQRIPLFSRYFFFNGRKYLISKWFRGITLCCLLTTILLLTYGSMKESFIFEVGGLAGVILGDEKSKSFSLLSIGTFIPMSVDDAYSSGSMLLQVIYFFYVGIMPMSCLLSLIFLLVVPLSYPHQEHFITFAEIANAWSAIEVFVLSILAALLELPTFAAFIVGHKCDIINQILVDKFHDVLNGQDTCYSLQAHVAFNVILLLVGVALNSYLVSNLLRLFHVLLLQNYDENSSTFKTLEILMDSSWRDYFFDSLDDDSTLDQPLLGDS